MVTPMGDTDRAGPGLRQRCRVRLESVCVKAPDITGGQITTSYSNYTDYGEIMMRRSSLHVNL